MGSQGNQSDGSQNGGSQDNGDGNNGRNNGNEGNGDQNNGGQGGGNQNGGDQPKGGAINPIAVRMVWEAASAVRIPVIGIGGIATAEDALEFLIAGASAVQVGTVNFIRPRATIEILEGLEAFCVKEGISRLGELIGSIRGAPAPA